MVSRIPAQIDHLLVAIVVEQKRIGENARGQRLPPIRVFIPLLRLLFSMSWQAVYWLFGHFFFNLPPVECAYDMSGDPGIG